jgi:hypothetical protein
VSTFTKGEQMVPVLQKLGVHCAVYGNHDFGETCHTAVPILVLLPAVNNFNHPMLQKK